jgi:hypothetical protein
MMTQPSPSEVEFLQSNQNNCFIQPVMYNGRKGFVISPQGHGDGKGGLSEMEPEKICVTKFEFWLGAIGMAVTIVAIVVGASWKINDSIHESANAHRQELTGIINTTKSDITSRIDRLEDKLERSSSATDSKLDQLITQTSVMQQSISNK